MARPIRQIYILSNYLTREWPRGPLFECLVVLRLSRLVFRVSRTYMPGCLATFWRLLEPGEHHTLI